MFTWWIKNLCDLFLCVLVHVLSSIKVTDENSGEEDDNTFSTNTEVDINIPSMLSNNLEHDFDIDSTNDKSVDPAPAFDTDEPPTSTSQPQTKKKYSTAVFYKKG